MWLCHVKRPTTSSGLWLEDSPLRADLPLLSIQIIFVVVICSLLRRALGPIGVPSIVCQILTGLILGPAVLGRITFFKNLYSDDNTISFKAVGILGMALFKFLLGVKVELGMIKKSGKKALAIGLSGYFVPLVLMMTAYHIFLGNPVFTGDSNLFNVFTFVWSESSLLVVACLLDELKLLNSKIGRLAVAACLIETSLALTTKTLVIATLNSVNSSFLNTLIAFAFLFALFVFIILIARPTTLWIAKRTPKGEPLAEGYFVTIIMLVFMCAFINTVLGQQVGLGLFYLGLALPSGPPVGSTLVERLEGIITALFFPVFVTMVTFTTDFSQLYLYMSELKGLVLLSFIICLIKVGVAVAPALYCRMPFFDIVALALILNSRGVAELTVLFGWADRSEDPLLYSTLLFLILLWAAITGPLIKIFYKPSNRYLGYKRRTIQHSRNSVELRVLTCIHTQEQVPSAINFLETLSTTQEKPICIYVLNLVELVGRVATVLLPYYSGKNSSHVTATTDHIFTAFRNFERKRNHPGVSLQPFISMSPYDSMYEDICTLALEKKVSLVLLPFHKTWAANGDIESTNQSLQAMNTSVLNYAPCTVAILVNYGSDLQLDSDVALVNNVVMYFFGGVDDREGLGLAMRMAISPRICLTLVRFMSKFQEPRRDTVEEKYDNEMLYEYRVQNMNIRKNMLYREEVLEDSEQVVNVIRSASQGADLLIVGKREGKRSMLLEGLSEWSEYPELGVIGDMLASKDFGSRVSILVVQQQPAGLTST